MQTQQPLEEEARKLRMKEYMEFCTALSDMFNDPLLSDDKKEALRHFIDKIEVLINGVAKPSPPSLYETIANWKQSKDLEEDIEALKRIDPSSNPLMKYLIQPIQRFLQLFFNFANPKTWQIFEAVTPEGSHQSARIAVIQHPPTYTKLREASSAPTKQGQLRQGTPRMPPIASPSRPNSGNIKSNAPYESRTSESLNSDPSLSSPKNN